MTDTGWDAVDFAILDQLGRSYAALDPPPADLEERVRFAIALQNLDVEVFRLQDEVLVGSGARGSERTRTITFDSASLTVMITITDGGPGVRLDGWLAPAGRLHIELRSAQSESTADTLTVAADEVGRFAFDRVPHGLTQLLVHPVVGSGVELASTVATPSLML